MWSNKQSGLFENQLFSYEVIRRYRITTEMVFLRFKSYNDLVVFTM